ncbi:Crp/Fnr family transcriptional regulator [Acinetobacter qingfengensis]|uniref:HTH crp-type domain-containing protein n=1 Tax=Acinetobacter qingfengensis TaxID=1262585 RepID=A0A1E7QWK9_9GAMM|nr:Crp/Fnr family transcriptional regulator [Acinetobacter qingfengensis]KAA8731263.1 Crp/Fnr family transcriptional regulator [Acinetobacter qingfengensis]OEY91490.1 hypothetical protein BJI46_07075 [Acinetobacter qingfengensis]
MNSFNDLPLLDIGGGTNKIIERRMSNHPVNKITNNYYQLAIEQLAEYKFFQLCTEEQKQNICHNLKIQHYPAEHYIYTADQTCNEVTFILNGIIRTAWTSPEGKHYIYKFLPAGILTNIVPIITHQCFGHDHISHEPTTVAIIPGDIFVNILQCNPKVLYAVFELICNRSHHQYHDCYYQTTQPLQIQLARQLLYLIEYFSIQFESNIKIRIKLSQENLAELLNTSRKNINRELAILTQEGIVKVRYHQIYILDFQKLKNLIQ